MLKVIIVLLAVFSSGFAQVYLTTWLGGMRDTAFILPGESFTNFINIQRPVGKKDLASCILYVDDVFPSPNILSGPIYLSAPLSSDSGGNFNFFIGDVYPGKRMIKVLPKSSDDYFESMTVGRTQFYSKGILGVANQKYTLEVEFKSGDIISYVGKSIYYKFVNRIRGDINGDGVVNNDDRDIAGRYSGNQMHSSIPGNRFSRPDEENLGAMILPGHSEPTRLTGPRLLNIFVNNPDDPAVKDIGFGLPMSETLPVSSGEKSGALAKTSAERFAWNLDGNILEVETKPYSAVNTFAFLSDGTMWQKDGFADANGYWQTAVEDASLDYQVEVCDLVGGPVNSTSVAQQQVALNTAFNSSSNVYDIMGRKIPFQQTSLQVVFNDNLPVLSLR